MVVDVLLDAVVDELADDPARNSPIPNPSRPRLPRVSRTATLPSRACATRITPSIETCVSLTSPQRLEVLRPPVDVLIARDEHVGRCLAITILPAGPAREDLNEALMFCREFTS